MRGMTDDERALVKHVIRWGSDGYPLHKAGRKWSWGSYLSIEGPQLYDTKREATAAFERYFEVLLDALGEEALAVVMPTDLRPVFPIPYPVLP